MRSLSRTMALGLCFVFFAGVANAQESVKDLAATASAELRLLIAFQTLERMTSQMDHFLIYSIQAERGGWSVNTVKHVENSYVIRSTAEDMQVEVARAINSIKKSKVATEDELTSAAAVEESLTVLITLASQIADLVDTGELDAAASSYRETGQTAHENAIRGTQSSVGTVQKRLGKTLLKIRIAK